jgi:hypothetical protein
VSKELSHKGRFYYGFQEIWIMLRLEFLDSRKSAP